MDAFGNLYEGISDSDSFDILYNSSFGGPTGTITKFPNYYIIDANDNRFYIDSSLFDFYMS